MKKLIIYGASFPDVIKLVDAINRKEPPWKIQGYLDDNKELQGDIIMGYPVLGGNAKIGDFVFARLRSLISHDVTIEDYVFIGSGANIGSNAVLKHGCYLGTGSIIMRKMIVGSSAIVGAGAVVTKDVPPNVTVAGVPAREMKRERYPA